MLPPPEKLTLEVEVDNLFRNGDKGNVARLIQKDASTVSRQLSPNCEHNNHVVYFFVQVLWALDCIRVELGQAVIDLVLRERAKWIGAEPATEHPAKLTGKVGHEYIEALEAEMSERSLDDQIAEWGDVVTAAANKQQSLIAKRTARFDGFTAPEPRSVTSTRITHNATREGAREVVKQHRNNGGPKK